MTAWLRALLCAALLGRDLRLCSCTDFFGTASREYVRAWRLVNGAVPSGNYWIVYEVRFFARYRVNQAAHRTECHDLLNVTDADIIASGSGVASGAAPPRNAFFNDGSYTFGWHSQSINATGQAWLGAVFPDDVRVKCVQLEQMQPAAGGAAEFHVTEVTLERRQDANVTWLDPYWEVVATWGQQAGEELVGGDLLTLPVGLPPRFAFDGTTTPPGPVVLVNVTERTVREETLDTATIVGMSSGMAVLCCCLGCGCLCWRLNSTKSTVGALHAPHDVRRSQSSLHSRHSRHSRQQKMPTWASYAADKISVGSHESESTFMPPHAVDNSVEADDPSFYPAVKPTVVSVASMPTNGRFPAFSDWVASVSPKNGRSPTDEGSKRFNMFSVMNPAHPRSPLSRWNPSALHRYEADTARSIETSNSQATATSDRTSNSGTRKVPRPPGPSWGITDRAPGVAWDSPKSKTRSMRGLDAQPEEPQPSSQDVPFEEPTPALEPDEERPRISTPDSSTGEPRTSAPEPDEERPRISTPDSSAEDNRSAPEPDEERPRISTPDSSAEDPRTSASRAQLRPLQLEMPPTPPNA